LLWPIPPTKNQRNGSHEGPGDEVRTLPGGASEGGRGERSRRSALGGILAGSGFDRREADVIMGRRRRPRT
jgi:hypothetical protein